MSKYFLKWADDNHIAAQIKDLEEHEFRNTEEAVSFIASRSWEGEYNTAPIVVIEKSTVRGIYSITGKEVFKENTDSIQIKFYMATYSEPFFVDWIKED